MPSVGDPMSEVLRAEILGLLVDVREAGRGAGARALERIVCSRLPALAVAADPYVGSALSATAQDRIVAAMLRRADANPRPQRLRVGTWGWAAGVGLAAAALWALAMLQQRPTPMASPAPAIVARPAGPPMPMAPGDSRAVNPTPPPRKGSFAVKTPRKAPSVGAIREVVGEPRVDLPSSARSILAGPGMRVAAGSTLVTGDADRLEVRFDDGTSLRLGFNTRLTVPDLVDFRLRPDFVTLEAGRLDAVVAHVPQAPPFRVETSAATAEVLGTTFDLHVDGQGASSRTTLRVREGRVAFFNGLGRVTATARTESRATPHARPTEPRRVVAHRSFNFGIWQWIEIGATEPGHIEILDRLAYPTGTIGARLETTPEGTVWVAEVAPGSPADRAGLRSGSMLVAVDGVAMPGPKVRGLIAEGAGSAIRLRTILENRLRDSLIQVVPADSRAPREWSDPALMAATRALLFGDAASARQSLGALVAAGGSAAAHNNLGLAQEWMGDLGAAVKSYAQAIRRAPAVGRYRANMGVALAAIGNLERSAEELAAAVRLNPRDAVARFELSETLSLLGRHGEALAALDPAACAVMDRPALLARRSTVILRSGDLQGSEAAAREALALAPESAWAWAYLSHSLTSQIRSEEANQAARRAVALNPANAFAHQMRAFGLQMAERRGREAGQHVRRAAELDPYEPEYQANLVAHELYLAGGVEAAAALGEQLIAKRRGGIGVYTSLIDALGDLGRIEEAERRYREASAVWPDDANLAQGMGVALSTNGRHREAEFWFREALARGPRTPGLLENLAQTCFESGRLDEAVALWQEALHVDPRYAPAHVGIGRVRLCQGREQEAVALLDKIREACGPPPSPFPMSEDRGLDLGAALARHRRQAEQERAMRAGLGADPSSPAEVDAYEGRLARLAINLCEQGRLDEADEMCRSWIAKHPNRVWLRDILVKTLVARRDYSDATLALARRNLRDRNHDDCIWSLARVLIGAGISPKPAGC